MSLSFIQEFEAKGDRPALVFPGHRTVTYAELARCIASRAALFGSGRRLVAIEAGTCEHAIITYLAALAAGHAVALLPPGQPALLDRFCDNFRPETTCRSIDGRWRTDADIHLDSAPLHADLALLLSTSGSTGISKSVRLSASALEANARSIASYLVLSEADRGLLMLPLHYSYGLSVLNSHLADGASLPCRAILCSMQVLPKTLQTTVLPILLACRSATTSSSALVCASGTYPCFAS